MGSIDLALKFNVLGSSLKSSMSKLSTGMSSAVSGGMGAAVKKSGAALGKMTSGFASTWNATTKAISDNFGNNIEKKGTKAGKSFWDKTKAYIKANPVTSFFGIGAALSFASSVFESFKALDLGASKLSAIFGESKSAISGMAQSLYASNLNVSMEDIMETMGAFAQEGVELSNKNYDMIDSVVAFKNVLGESADAVIGMIGALDKSGKGGTDFRKMLGSTIGEWGKMAPKAIDSIAKFAMATGASGDKVAKGYNKIGGALKQMGATAEVAQEFMAGLMDQDYRKLPPMFQAFAHLRGDGDKFAKAIAPTMKHMQNVFRNVPSHLIPALAESMGISTEIANAMATGVNYQTAMDESNRKKKAQDIKDVRAKMQANITNMVEGIKRGMELALFGSIGKNQGAIEKMIKGIGDALLKIGAFFQKIFSDPATVEAIENLVDGFVSIIKFGGEVAGKFGNLFGEGTDATLNVFKALLLTLLDPRVLITLGALRLAAAAQGTTILGTLGKATVGTASVAGQGIKAGAVGSFGLIKRMIGIKAAPTLGASLSDYDFDTIKTKGASDAAESAAKAGEKAGKASDKMKKPAGFFTKANGQAFADYFKAIAEVPLAGIGKFAAIIVAVGAATAIAVAAIGYALKDGRGKAIIDFFKGLAETLAILIVALGEFFAMIISGPLNAVAGVIGAVANWMGDDDDAKPAQSSQSSSFFARPSKPPSPAAVAAMTKGLSDEADAKATDNELLRDIRTILLSSLDMERGILGAAIDQTSISKSKLLLQEVSKIRDR